MLVWFFSFQVLYLLSQWLYERLQVLVVFLQRESFFHESVSLFLIFFQQIALFVILIDKFSIFLANHLNHFEKLFRRVLDSESKLFHDINVNRQFLLRIFRFRLFDKKRATSICSKIRIDRCSWFLHHSRHSAGFFYDRRSIESFEFLIRSSWAV